MLKSRSLFESIHGGNGKQKLTPKTKIACTLGPNTRSVEMIEKLLTAGMNIARFNFCLGNRAYHQETLDNLRSAMHNTGILCAVMLHTQGPKISTGYVKKLTEDGVIVNVPAAVAVNHPAQFVDLPTLTDKDERDVLEWGIPNKVDIISLSFVRNALDLVAVRKLLGSDAQHFILMSQVKNEEGLTNFNEILAHSDAVMVAWDDLGLNIPVEEMAAGQKMIVSRCNMEGVPVITAIKMESMMKTSKPTDAEAVDIATGVVQGTDCVMLMHETAYGAYPELAVQTVARICAEAEGSLNYREVLNTILAAVPRPMSLLESLAYEAVEMANTTKATLILVLTRDGGTIAKLVSKYRPSVPIFSVVLPELSTDYYEARARHCLIYRALVPVLGSSDAEESVVSTTLEQAKAEQICKAGDTFLLLNGAQRGGLKMLTIN